MSQQANKLDQHNTSVRIPPTPEQAKKIARQSHARLIAQRQKVQEEKVETQKAQIQIPLVKKAVSQTSQPISQTKNEQSQPTSASGVVGIRRTKNGAPDRRYLENQHLTRQQAEIERAKFILRNSGVSE